MSSFAAALTALLLLSYASVRSIVMQVEMASPVAAEPLPGGEAAPVAMPGMDMPAISMAHAKPAPYAGSKHRSSRPAACPYCSAAAHLPILGGVAVLHFPTAFIFAAFRIVASHGPRGPPATRPRARGPPTDPPTL